MAATHSQVLRGRAHELRTLGRLLDEVRGGQSAVIVIRGEPGVGKTALLRHAAEQASQFRVAHISGIESEMELPFAGLHQLCTPMTSTFDTLPPHQQTALRVALGTEPGDPPDRFLVGLAVLGLLAEVAADRPLACFVDDAQWLDSASGQALTFVARRLAAESVLLVFAVREPSAERYLSGLPELAVAGLAEPHARDLLLTATSSRVDARVLDRIVAETRGNPLALLELPRAMTAAELGGGFANPWTGDVPHDIEEMYLQRLRVLSEDVQTFVLLAAAEPTGDPALLWRAAALLGMDRAAAAPAEADHLLEVGARVQFRHPLVRSAVYRSASPASRRPVHEALAAATDGAADPDRRVWHLAAATLGPDEDVAAALERSAIAAQARGGVAAAAAFLQRSLALTADPTRRADRAVAAAQLNLQAGTLDTVPGLLAFAESGPLGELQRAQIELIRGHVAFASALGAEAPALLLGAARHLERLDVGLARETVLIAWGAAGMAGGGAGDVLSEICRAARTVPRPEGSPRPLDSLLDGLALLTTDGHAVATPLLVRAATELVDITLDDVVRWGWMATAASSAVWDFNGMQSIAAHMVRLLRAPAPLRCCPSTSHSSGTALPGRATSTPLSRSSPKPKTWQGRPEVQWRPTPSCDSKR